MMFLTDSAHIWHVAKTGNDGNGGHAQQYPIALAVDAKLTINNAIAAAAAGDTIIVWPGTYAEYANFTKKLNIVGFGPQASVVNYNLNHAICLNAAGCRLKGVGGISTSANKYGISTGAQDDIVIEDCYGDGDYDGIHLMGSSDVRVLNSHAKGKYDGLQIDDGENILVDGCIAETDGSNTAGTVNAIKTNDCKNLIIRNTVAKATRALNGDDKHLIGININGKALIENVIAYVNHTGTGDNHNTRGLQIGATGNVVCKNLNIHVDRSAGNWYGADVSGKAVILGAYFELGLPIGTCYRITSSGQCYIANIGCDFNVTPDNGTIYYMNPLTNLAGEVVLQTPSRMFGML